MVIKKILITSSRRPNRRIRSFIKDLEDVLPGAVRITRGHKSMKELAFEAYSVGADRVVVVSDKRGNPGILRVYRVVKKGEVFDLKNIVSFIVKGVSLSRERKAISPSKASKRARKLLVVTEGVLPRVEYEFAEAFRYAFHASFNCNVGLCVEANLKGLDEKTVIVSFKFKENNIGPLMKLGKPAVLLKERTGVADWRPD